MSLVTIGLDFGTSSIKCVARPALARNEQVEVLPARNGSLRWRSVLGRVREGPEAGRLLFFEECDEERWRFAAVIESNLKLALLASAESPTAAALRSRWDCACHYAPSVLLLAAALQRALKLTRLRWPGRAIHVFCGAPVSPFHPPSQIIVFERALFAAALLCERWGDVRPSIAEVAVRQAEMAWLDSEDLPTDEERETFVVPEAFAACEGVASAGGSVGLPTGRLCIVDMGGGTTDVAWVVNSGGNAYNPLRIDSFDIAGERLEAVIAGCASRLAGRRVPRTEIWDARRGWNAADPVLRGDDWTIELETIRTELTATFQELASQFRNAMHSIDPDHAKAPPTSFIFVGGATQWEPLAKFFLEAVIESHERVETVAVSGLGVKQPAQEVPLAVSLGLSNGHTTLDLERWDSAMRAPPRRVPEPAEALIAECSCRGLLELCPKCGGSGARDFASAGDRFSKCIDPFRVHAFPVRCPFCQCDYSVDRIFAHIADRHSDRAVVSPPPPPLVALPAVAALSIDRIRLALASGDRRALTEPEGVLEHDLRWLHEALIGQGHSAREISRSFLRGSVSLAGAHPWLRLPRAIAFALRDDWRDVDRELASAEAAGFGYCRRLTSILRTERPTRFVEAWEFIVR